MTGSTGRWMAAGVCVACVVALQWVPAPQQGIAPHRIDKPARAARVAATPAVVGLARTPTLHDASPIALDIDIARKAVRDGELRIALPDGTTYPVRIERQETDRLGSWSVIGRVRTATGPRAAVLTFGNGAVFGTLPMPDGRLLQVATNHGEVVATLDGGMTPGTLPAASDIATQRVKRGDAKPLIPMLARASLRREVAASASAPSQLAPPAQAAQLTQAAAALPLITVTVLATYGDDLIAKRGTEAAVQTEVSNLVATANQAHIDSGSRVRLQLVAKSKLAVPPAWSNTDALYMMTVSFIGDVDTEVLRNQFSADLVTYVRPFADYENCGIAWTNGSDLDGTDADSLMAYSVVAREPCGNYTLAHELGHNLGAAHDRETMSDNPEGELYYGAFTDSFGWRGWSGREFADIMSYNTRGETVLGVFSTPKISTCNDNACGVAGRADVVATFDRMAQTIADFRRTNGKGSVSDASAQGFCTSSRKLRFPIRLSTQPLATTMSVTATVVSGAEYLRNYSGPETLEFGPYQQQANFEREVIFNCPAGAPRQVTIKLSNPVGFTLEDDTAVGTITDVEPKRVQGVIDPGPETYFDYITFATHGAYGPRFEDSGAWQFPNSNSFFMFDVMPGASVMIDGGGYGDTWRLQPTLLQEVTSPLQVRIPLIRAHRIQGNIYMPGTSPSPLPPTGDYHQTFREIYKGRVLQEDSIQTGGAFVRYVMPGSTVEIIVEADAPDGYIKPYFARILNVQSDMYPEWWTLQQHSAFIVGGRPVREGAPGSRTTVPIGIQLTGPAPAGGVAVNWRAVNGTAVAGSDYVAISGQVQFAPGQSFKVVAVEVLGDGVPEPDEYFDVVLNSATGAPISAGRVRVDLLDDEPRKSDPGQKDVVAM
jgi:hypothetical protein